MTTTKGQTHGAKRVATASKAKKPAKGNTNVKSSAGIRKSTQAIRRRTDRPVRVQSQPVKHHNDDDALFRAKATAVAERAARQNAIREFREANKLTVGQWVAVTLFLICLVLAGVLVGRVA